MLWWLMMLRSSILTQDILVSRSPGSPEARQQNILAASPSCAVTLLRHEAREITPRLRLWAGSGSGALPGWPTHPARGRGSVIGNIINWSCLPIKMSSSVKSRKHYHTSAATPHVVKTTYLNERKYGMDKSAIWIIHTVVHCDEWWFLIPALERTFT